MPKETSKNKRSTFHGKYKKGIPATEKSKKMGKLITGSSEYKKMIKDSVVTFEKAEKSGTLEPRDTSYWSGYKEAGINYARKGAFGKEYKRGIPATEKSKKMDNITKSSKQYSDKLKIKKKK